MEKPMFIVTFYSYKGGVGRTLALVNTASRLAAKGKSVFVLDFDLEAPGIDAFNLWSDGQPHQGIVEYEDTGSIIVKFLSGAIGTINYTVNSFEKNLEGSITIFGERGVVKIGGQYLNELEYQNIKEYKIKDLLPHNYKPRQS